MMIASFKFSVVKIGPVRQEVCIGQTGLSVLHGKGNYEYGIISSPYITTNLPLSLYRQVETKAGINIMQGVKSSTHDKQFTKQIPIY